MNWELLVLLPAGLFIAYVNGANDVANGIATLVGSGVADYKRTILWGTVWTGIGGLAGALLAGAMVETFGSGLLAEGSDATLAAALATIAGAGLWVALATRTGLPVSTTHAIVGSLAGVGTMAYGLAGFSWTALGSKIALPLILSPVAAVVASGVLIQLWGRFGSDSRSKKADCVCVFVEPPDLMADADSVAYSAAVFSTVRPGMLVAEESECRVNQSGFLRLSFNRLHWLTSGGTSFARGLNDAPKIVALILAAGAVSGAEFTLQSTTFLLVALGMMAGSWLAGKRVTGVMAEKITPMDHQEGFIANLVTAAMVGPGAAMGLPMSTTHVSSGAILGLGSKKDGRLNWTTVRHMLLAWVVTLPAAAILGVAVFGMLRFAGLS